MKEKEEEMKDKTINAILIAAIVAIMAIWVLLGLSFAETGTMIFNVEKDKWDTAPPKNQLLFIGELAKIYIDKYPSCTKVIIEKFTDDREIHFKATCRKDLILFKGGDENGKKEKYREDRRSGDGRENPYVPLSQDRYQGAG